MMLLRTRIGILAIALAAMAFAGCETMKETFHQNELESDVSRLEYIRNRGYDWYMITELGNYKLADEAIASLKAVKDKTQFERVKELANRYIDEVTAIRDKIYEKAQASSQKAQAVLAKRKAAGDARRLTWKIAIPESFWDSTLVVRDGVLDFGAVKIKDLFLNVVYIENKALDGSKYTMDIAPESMIGDDVVLVQKISLGSKIFALIRYRFTFQGDYSLLTSVESEKDGQKSRVEGYRDLIDVITNSYINTIAKE